MYVGINTKIKYCMPIHVGNWKAARSAATAKNVLQSTCFMYFECTLKTPYLQYILLKMFRKCLFLRGLLVLAGGKYMYCNVLHVHCKPYFQLF